jgi:hypothetical protein
MFLRKSANIFSRIAYFLSFYNIYWNFLRKSAKIFSRLFCLFYKIFPILSLFFLNKVEKKAENHKDDSLFSAAEIARLKNTASLLSQTS